MSRYVLSDGRGLMTPPKKLTAAAMRDLDQFYTTSADAQWCAEQLKPFLPGYPVYLEPSAGDGVFLPYMPRATAYDLYPMGPGIIQQDFLTLELPYDPNRVSLGNPPYGKRSQLAINFLNHCATMGDVVAFVLPPSFRKWMVQSKINEVLSLVFDQDVPGQDYRLPNDTLIPNHRRVFQIWKREESKLGGTRGLRLCKAPPISHPDFQMWQYNNTPGALAVFKNKFDFAVPRQGYYDYTRRETIAERCERNIQWILFKANSVEVLERLNNLDFGKLAERNTVTPGFGKADVVAFYCESLMAGGFS